MSDYIDVAVCGRATKDVELKTTQSGKEVCSFSVASNLGWGENQSVKYTNVVVWGKLAQNVSKYVRKGTEVIVNGELTVRSYDHNGEKKTVEEVNATRVKWFSKEKVEENNTMDIAVEDEELPF